MKINGKRMLSALLFTALLAALLWLSSGLFVPKDNSEEDGIRNAGLYGFLGEEPNTLDVLVVGDSMGQCSVSPVDIWREQGITSYNCCTGNQKLYEARNHLKMVLENQKPALVLLEADAIYSGSPITDMLSDSLYKVLPVFQYHDRWKTLQKKDWLGTVEYTHTDTAKGFHISTEVNAVAEENIARHMEYTDDAKSIGRVNVRYVRWMEELCEENGIRLILFSAPSTYSWNTRKHNGIALLAEQMKLPYLDLNLMPEEVPIDWHVDTMDWGNHMDCAGAKKVSSYLGNYLKETGLFTDKRGTAEYSNWDNGVPVFDEIVANWVKKET